MALTADREYEVVGETEILEIEAGAADVLYKGGLMNVGADGYLKVAADVAAESCVGVMKKQHVADGVAHEKVAVERGRIWLPHAGAAQTDVGALFHASADDTLTDGAGVNVSGFLCVGWKPGYLLIDFGRKTI